MTAIDPGPRLGQLLCAMVVCMASVAPAAAETLSTPFDVERGSTTGTHDLQRLISAGLRLPEKDTFETSEQHAQRLATAISRPIYGKVSLSDLLVFSMPLDGKKSTQNIWWSYDAENEQVMLGGIPMLGPPDESTRGWFPMCGTVKMTGSRTFQAQNGFGVKATVTELEGEQTCVSTRMPNWEIAKLSAQLPRATAAQELKHPRLQIVGRIIEPIAGKRFSRIKPTLGYPTGTSITTSELFLRPVELRLIGSSSNKVILKVRFSQTDDVLTDMPEPSKFD